MMKNLGIPPVQGGVLHDKKLQTMSKIKRESFGGPNNAKTGLVGVL
jgi:hypothetical protein